MNAFKSGQLAYDGNKNISDNPYKDGTDMHRDWESGWFDAEGYAEYLREQLEYEHRDERLQDIERYDYSMFISDFGG